jgi:hypothetical protein
MKTFSEFISERYYEPDEPLPSGKTPYGKATSSYYRQKGEYFRGGRQNPQHFDRVLTQIQRRNNEVSRGADNPNFDNKPDKTGRYDIDTDSNYRLTVRDRKNDLEMRVRQKDQIAPGNKPVYDVEWYNHRQGSKSKNPGEARGVVRSVADMWKNQVAPRIPSNVVLTNFPISNADGERNTRSKLYSKVAGFGEPGSLGRQYANVGRNPSSKQVAKGAQRITPLSGNLDPEWSYNRRELDKLGTPPHKPKAYWAGTERARGERRRIAPAKPSRPSVRQATQALQATPRVQAPALPRPSASTIPLSSSRLRLRGRAGLALGAAALGAGALAAALNRPKK